MAHRHRGRRGRQQRHWRRLGKLLLTLGFLALTVGLVAAWFEPAAGYELDIYGATPTLFWIGFGVALLLSLLLAMASRVATVKWTALYLGGLAMVGLVSLPIIRGYVFYGLADSLTHLGWAGEIQTAVKSPFEFIYPGSHLTAVVFQSTTGKSLPWAMMLVVVATLVVFFLFTPLAIRSMVPTPAAVVVGTFSAFMLLPLNNVATHNMYHPFSMTVLLVPLMLYLVFRHVGRAADDDALPSSMAATSLVMPIVGIAMLFYHPQATLDMLIVLATAVGVQVLIGRLWPNSRLAGHRVLYGQVVLLSIVFVVWIFQFWQTWAMAEGVLESFMATIDGSAIVGENVQETGEEGEGLGISLYELYAKLFVVSSVYVLVAIGLVLAKVLKLLEAEPDRDIAIAYFAASGATLTPFFMLHFIGDISGYFFRHLGFGMALVTVLAGAALALLVGWSKGVGNLGKSVRPVIAVVLVVCLVLSVAVAYPSPFVYKRGHGLSGQVASGYQTSLGYDKAAGDNATRWADVNGGVERYDDAMYYDDSVGYSGTVSPENLTRLVDHFGSDSGDQSEDYKVPISAVSVQHSTEIRKGVGYEPSHFQSLERQEGVHRVQSNEEFRLYYVETRFNRSSV